MQFILYACNLQYFRILRVRNFQKNQFVVNLKAPKCSESVELQGSRKEVMGICEYKNSLPVTNILNTANTPLKRVLKGSLAFMQYFKFVNWMIRGLVFDVTNRLPVYCAF